MTDRTIRDAQRRVFARAGEERMALLSAVREAYVAMEVQGITEGDRCRWCGAPARWERDVECIKHTVTCAYQNAIELWRRITEPGRASLVSEDAAQAATTRDIIRGTRWPSEPEEM